MCVIYAKGIDGVQKICTCRIDNDQVSIINRCNPVYLLRFHWPTKFIVSPVSPNNRPPILLWCYCLFIIYRETEFSFSANIIVLHIHVHMYMQWKTRAQSSFAILLYSYNFRIWTRNNFSSVIHGTNCHSPSSSSSCFSGPVNVRQSIIWSSITYII